MIALRWALLPVVVLGMLAAIPPAGAEEAQPAAEAAVNWPAKLREWRKWYTTEMKDAAKTPEAAREQIAAIKDPAAIRAILALLKTEKAGQFRRALILPLIEVGGQDAVAMLVKLSVEDDNGSLREEAALGLAGKPELPQFLDKYIDYLYKPQFSAAAAQALRGNKLAVRDSVGVQLDPKLTKALIAALVQKQKKLVPHWRAYDTGPVAGYEESTFDALNGRYANRRSDFYRKSGRFAGYEQKWVRVDVPTPNEQAYQTLKKYTSQDYQYDQQNWSERLFNDKSR